MLKRRVDEAKPALVKQQAKTKAIAQIWARGDVTVLCSVVKGLEVCAIARGEHRVVLETNEQETPELLQSLPIQRRACGLIVECWKE